MTETDMTDMSFDFDSYKAACEARSTPAWLAFYADDVHWLEYRLDPLILVSRAVGRSAIGETLTELGRWPDLQAIEEPEVDVDRIRFRAVSRPAGSRRMVDHVMLTIAGDRIQRQVSVVAFET
jgi:hypothetical protein